MVSSLLISFLLMLTYGVSYTLSLYFFAALRLLIVLLSLRIMKLGMSHLVNRCLNILDLTHSIIDSNTILFGMKIPFCS